MHVSRRLLDASAALVREGIPLAAVLAASRELRAHTDAIADLFTTLLRDHVVTGDLAAEELVGVTGTLERMRPVSQEVVEAELGLALDRRLRAELDRWGESPDG